MHFACLLFIGFLCENNVVQLYSIAIILIKIIPSQLKINKNLFSKIVTPNCNKTKMLNGRKICSSNPENFFHCTNFTYFTNILRITMSEHFTPFVFGWNNNNEKKNNYYGNIIYNSTNSVQSNTLSTYLKCSYTTVQQIYMKPEETIICICKTTYLLPPCRYWKFWCLMWSAVKHMSIQNTFNKAVRGTSKLCLFPIFIEHGNLITRNT